MKLGKFETWLVEQGAVILPPTNQWEVIRFRTINGVSVVYTNKHGHLTFTGESNGAYKKFERGQEWKISDRKTKKLKAHKARLATRDGKKCFFCEADLPFEELTIEHLVAVKYGGPDHDSNLCLACQPCNQKVDRWPVTQKMLYRDKMLSKRRIKIDVH